MEGLTHASAPVQAAYSYCEAVTGAQARNFAYGIRLLPIDKRQAMSALYAFSRRVDDIGDGTLAPEAKFARLEETRALLGRIRAEEIDEDDTDPVAVALTHAARRFPIPLGGLDELIDGVLMDVRGETYETWDDLKTYCRCVAGAIGRLSLGVFGTVNGSGLAAADAERAGEYADTLGLALQLTNILRDVREDAGNGRTYLPAEDLAKFGCSTASAASGCPPEPTSPGWSTTKYGAPAPCSPRATGCCRCSTGAAAPAWPPWPVSTGGCWTASNGSRRRCCGAACRCRRTRRRTSPCAACPASTRGPSPARTPGGEPDDYVGSRRARPDPDPGNQRAGGRVSPQGLRTGHGRGARSGPSVRPGGPLHHGGGRMTGFEEHAVVVGGGLAGVTTALELADAGLRVTLLEGRPRLGGLAFSFKRGDLEVDNGQHVYLRCCTAYRWFLDRVDGAALAPLQDRLDVPVLDVARPGGPRLGGCAAAPCPCPCTWPDRSPATRTSPSPSA